MPELSEDDVFSKGLVTAPLKFRDNVVKGVDDSIAALDSLISKSLELDTVITGSKSVKKLTDDTKSLSQAELELDKVSKQIATTQAKNNTLYIQEAKTLETVKKALKEKTALGDRDSKSITAQNASRKELAAALAKNRADYYDLANAEERSAEAGADLLKIINQQDEDLKALSKSTGQSQLEVGNYEGSMKGLKIQLKAANDELAGIAATLGINSDEFQVAAKKAGDLNDEIKDLKEVTTTFTGEPIEKLGQAFKFTVDKVKALDFKGAKVGLKALFDLAKNNPYIILAAVILTIVGLMVALKDKIKPLVVIFNAIGNAIDDIIEKIYEWTDALGLTEHAQEKRSAKFIESMEKERVKLGERYDAEIALQNAAHKNSLKLEADRANAARRTTEAIIGELEKQVAKKKADGFRETSDEIKELRIRLAEERKTLAAAELDAVTIIEKKKDREKQFQEDMRAIRDKSLADDRASAQLSLQAQIEAQKTIAETVGNGYNKRATAAQTATDLEIKSEKKALADKMQIYQDEIDAISRKYKTDEQDSLVASAQIAEVNKRRVLDEKQTTAAIVEIKKSGTAQQTALLLEQLDFEASVIKEVQADEHETYDIRIQATNDFYDKEKNILDIRLKEKLITIQAYNNEVFKLEQATTDELVKLTEERIQKQADAAQQNANVGTDQELINLEKSLDDRDFKLKDYEKKKEKIQQTGYLNGLTMQLKYLEQERSNLESYGINTTAIQQSIADTELAIEQAKNEKLLEGRVAVHEKLQELEQVAAQSAMQIIEDQFAAADEARAAESDRIQKNLENDLTLAGDNEARKVELKQQAEVQLQRIRLEQAAADRKRAIFEKATAAVSIAINTAKGVGQALGTFPPPVSFILAAVTLALGAVQLAAVLSKPIPQYARGTKGKGHPGGPAVVGERGSELYILPTGEHGLTPDHATVMDMPAGTEVIPNPETMTMLARNSMASRDSTRATRRDMNGMDYLGRKLDTLNHTMRNKKELNINISRRGVEGAMKNAQSAQILWDTFYK